MQQQHAAGIRRTPTFVRTAGVFTLDFGVTPQSVVHWLGALLFVGGANTHCTAALELFQARRLLAAD